MSDPTTLENRFTGERLVLRRIAPETGPEYIELEGSLPAGGKGPPLHIHPLQVEDGIVLSGTLGAEVDGRRVTLRAGERAVFERGVAHAWWNAGDDVLTFQGRVTPALRFDEILGHLFDAVNRSPSGRPSLFDVAWVMHTYRDEYRLAVIPRVVGAVLFPLVVALGTLLGRYRRRAPLVTAARGAPPP